MHIAILEDNQEDRQNLRQMLYTYFKSRKREIQISEFSCMDTFLQALYPDAFQIAFLDILLNGENGMDAAQKVFKTDPNCRLVFITISPDYAVDSYLVRAAYYLTKPLNQSRLHDALEICCCQMDHAAVQLTVQNIPTQVMLKDIYYVDCESRMVRLHLMDQVLAIDESFAGLSEILLADARFLACNRGVLVNMDHIRQVSEGDFLMKNQKQVPIRIHGRKEIKKAWMTYSLKALERRTPR